MTYCQALPVAPDADYWVWQTPVYLCAASAVQAPDCQFFRANSLGACQYRLAAVSRCISVDAQKEADRHASVS